MELKAGLRLRSQIGTTEVIVVKAPSGDTALTCAGHPMIQAGESPADGLDPRPQEQDEAQLGKRYTDATDAVELLVTKAGVGSFAVAGTVLQLKSAKPLPASD